MDTIYIWNPSPPEGGEPEEEKPFDNACHECGKSLDYESDISDMCQCYSPCCGAEIIHHDICSQCKEHI
jgi:hypothetical protein